MISAFRLIVPANSVRVNSTTPAPETYKFVTVTSHEHGKIGKSNFHQFPSRILFAAFQLRARHRINTHLIKEHWDDLPRLAGSLKLGVVQATSIMRTLQAGERPTKLARAVAARGRIDKTIHA